MKIFLIFLFKENIFSKFLISQSSLKEKLNILFSEYESLAYETKFLNSDLFHFFKSYQLKYIKTIYYYYINLYKMDEFRFYTPKEELDRDIGIVNKDLEKLEEKLLDYEKKINLDDDIIFLLKNFYEIFRNLHEEIINIKIDDLNNYNSSYFEQIKNKIKILDNLETSISISLKNNSDLIKVYNSYKLELKKYTDILIFKQFLKENSFKNAKFDLQMKIDTNFTVNFIDYEYCNIIKEKSLEEISKMISLINIKIIDNFIILINKQKRLEKINLLFGIKKNDDFKFNYLFLFKNK